MPEIMFKVMTKVHQGLFDASKGRVSGKAMGMPVVKLTTTGRRSGQPRHTMLTAPVVDGDTVVIVASKGGGPTDPLWYRNLQADPKVTVTMTGSTRAMVARTATEAEHDELWPKIVASYKGYAGYQQKTDRTIPVVILEPA